MKIRKEQFVLARARNIGQKMAEAEFDRMTKLVSDKKKDRVKVYLDEMGNEVHVKGPLVDRVRKTESLAERIARYDRLYIAVRANRQAMQSMLFEESEEGDDDYSSMEDVETRDDFGEIVNTPQKEPEIGVQEGGQPAAPQSQAGDKPTVEPVSEPETVQE